MITLRPFEKYSPMPAAIPCDLAGYKGTAGACECEAGYAGTVSYADGEPTGCTGTSQCTTSCFFRLALPPV